MGAYHVRCGHVQDKRHDGSVGAPALFSQHMLYNNREVLPGAVWFPTAPWLWLSWFLCEVCVQGLAVWSLLVNNSQHAGAAAAMQLVSGCLGL